MYAVHARIQLPGRHAQDGSHLRRSRRPSPHAPRGRASSAHHAPPPLCASAFARSPPGSQRCPPVDPPHNCSATIGSKQFCYSTQTVAAMLGHRSSVQARPGRPGPAGRPRPVARAPIGGRTAAPSSRAAEGRQRVPRAAGDPSDGSQPPANDDSLDARIASGEFSSSGSTKEQLTRPVRKLLAQDPVGIGARDTSVCRRAALRGPRSGRHALLLLRLRCAPRLQPAPSPQEHAACDSGFGAVQGSQ